MLLGQYGIMIVLPSQIADNYQGEKPGPGVGHVRYMAGIDIPEACCFVVSPPDSLPSTSAGLFCKTRFAKQKLLTTTHIIADCITQQVICDLAL